MKIGIMMVHTLTAVSLTMIPLLTNSAGAQEIYPSRPIQIIVPFPPGGVADLVARPLGSALEKILKQPVVVVNKIGAGGAVGIQTVSVAKPDGYTLLVALASITVMPEVDAIFGRSQTYKLEDFAPIALLTRDPLILVVRRESPWRTLQEFVADAKRRPDEIKYSSGGVYAPMHLGTELFAQTAGIKLRHIPTAGGTPALNAILGGHVDCTLASLWGYAHIKSGDLRALGCMGGKRSSTWPDIPTFKEMGYNAEFYMWSGFFAPRATPPNVMAILREATRKAANSAEFKTTLEKMDNPPTYLDSDEFQRFLDKDTQRSIEVVRRIGKVQ